MLGSPQEMLSVKWRVRCIRAGSWSKPTHRVEDRLIKRWPCFVHGVLDPFEAPTPTCGL
jgi:hypothetical protein